MAKKKTSAFEQPMPTIAWHTLPDQRRHAQQAQTQVWADPTLASGWYELPSAAHRERIERNRIEIERAREALDQRSDARHGEDRIGRMLEAKGRECADCGAGLSPTWPREHCRRCGWDRGTLPPTNSAVMKRHFEDVFDRALRLEDTA